MDGIELWPQEGEGSWDEGEEVRPGLYFFLLSFLCLNLSGRYGEKEKGEPQ